MRNINEVNFNGKKVLMRVDFNVPMDDNGSILDDVRIQAAIPTIEHISAQEACLILMSHLGRPDGKRNPKYSLRPVAVRLEKLLGREIKMADDCIGPGVEELVDRMKPGEILLLENVRFHPEEEENDEAFSEALARLADVYVNDAFGTAHRAHSSTAGVAELLPAYAGFLMEKEVSMLQKVLEHPESPRMAILGGAKVKDKLGLIRNLLDKMDILLIGGGMANTFLKAQGINIGKSICEDKLLSEAHNFLDLAQQKGKAILLPLDVVVTDELNSNAAAIAAELNNIPDDKMIVDIGPRSIEHFSAEIAKAHTIIWNGPVGVYEYDQFAVGTEGIARAIAGSSAVSVVGGGDSAAVIHKLGIEDQFTHISTGGGATLEYLEGIQLPGVKSCEW